MELIAKEKAIELVQKFPLNAHILHYGDAPTQYKEHSKQCALIAVDEILFALNDDDLYIQGETNIDDIINYYQQVKTEINKL